MYVNNTMLIVSSCVALPLHFFVEILLLLFFFKNNVELVAMKVEQVIRPSIKKRKKQ